MHDYVIEFNHIQEIIDVFENTIYTQVQCTCAVHIDMYALLFL